MEDAQKAIMIVLIAFAIGITTLYVVFQGFDDSFVKEIVIGSWTIMLLAIGAAFRKLGLSKSEEKKLE